MSNPLLCTLLGVLEVLRPEDLIEYDFYIVPKMVVEPDEDKTRIRQQLAHQRKPRVDEL